MDCSFKYVIIVNLIVGITTKQNNCLNLNTHGFTVPRGDIVLSYGEDLSITCNLDNDVIDRYGTNASSRMYFRRGNEMIPREMTDVLNSTSIRLHIEKHPMAVSDTYYCYIEANRTAEMLCFNTVIVGVAPQNITDFSCISRNYENLTCTWTPPKNYVVTDYTLNYSLKVRPSRFIYSCPKIETLENGQQRCFWDSSTNPQYRPVHKCYYFLFHMNNTFGSIENYFTFEHYKYVRPNPPENLTAVATSPHSINLSWKIPSTMVTFTPGLHHRIMYQCEYYEKVWQFGALLTKDVKNKTLSYTLDGLKYAHSLCDIRVSMRSAEADDSDEFMWSENATITVRTESKIPDCPPKTNIGSFEVINNGLNWDAYIYWQHLKEEQMNGENFTYKIEVENHPEMSPAEMTKAYATFKNLSFTDYVINIWSVNEKGRSKEKSTVVVPVNRLDEPMNFIKVAKEYSFELSWEPPKKSRKIITNYTIFWCKNERDRPFPCVGSLNWTTVPRNTKVHKQALMGNDIYQFAISANSWNSSSGMSWAECTIIPNRSMGKIKNVWINTVGSDYINVGWKLDCSNRVGTIEQFIIFFCPVESITQRSCKNFTEKNMTVGGNEQSANITQLQPYTTYRLTIGYRFNANTYSQTSDPLCNTTNEAAPDTPPLNVEVYNVTNSSISLKWDPPKKTNGVLKYYQVSYTFSEQSIKVDGNGITLQNLMSFENYVISIKACTVYCSKESALVNVTTKMGSPNKMPKPSISSQNDSYTTIIWDKPSPARGNVNYYQLKMSEQPDPDEDSVLQFKNVTSQNFVIESCASGKYKTLFLWVRAVNIIDGQHNAGEWSDYLESSCPSYIFILYMVMGSLGVVVIIGATCAFRKVHDYWKRARDIDPKLPPGLAPDLLCSEKSKDIDLIPSADAQSLLPPLNETHMGGDSSGCSSYQESIASSLESTAHISPSDSGTEQPRSPSLSENRKSACRLRTVATTRPTGYVTVDTVNTTNWPPKPPSNSAGNYCVLGVGLEPPKKLKVDSPYIPISDLKNTKLPLNFSSDLSQPPPPYVMTGEIVKNLNPVNPGYVPYTIPEASDKNLGLYELVSSNN